MIGERLNLARRASGLSLRDLEEKIGELVSAQAIGKYERNAMVPSSKVLMALSNALGVTESFLLSPAEIELTGAEFRTEISSERVVAALRARVMTEVSRYLEIENIVGVVDNWNFPDHFPHTVHEDHQADMAAIQLRDYWLLGKEPVINLAELLEEHGIKVLFLPLPTDVSGMMCWVHRKDASPIPVITINDQHDGERQRFSLMHEVGHLMMQIPASVPARKKEKLCHRFASSFLIPAEIIWANIGKKRQSISLEELFSLKSVLRVSAQAIIYRCKDLEIIGQATFRALFEHFENAGWRKSEPMKFASEPPSRFGRLCARALAEGAASDSKIAELLDVRIRELPQKLMDITKVHIAA